MAASLTNEQDGRLAAEGSVRTEDVIDPYDPTYIYGWGNLVNSIGLLVSKNYDMLASQEKSLQSRLVKDIETAVKAYEKLD